MGRQEQIDLLLSRLEPATPDLAPAREKVRRDDEDGYLVPQLGEEVADRYHVTSIAGRGVFSCVLKAIDAETGDRVALKVLRSQAMFRAAGQHEASVVKKISSSGKSEGNYIKLRDQFNWQGHLTLVYEGKAMDLREVLKRQKKQGLVGIGFQALKQVGKAIFSALSTLHSLGLVHCDLKPDNILVDQWESGSKLPGVVLADFGSTIREDQAPLTRYLASRYYRAPEVMLGIQPLSGALDIWSLGVTLFELATGKVMFTGSTNNEMLWLFMLTKGKISSKLLKKAAFEDQYFNERGLFQQPGKDGIIRGVPVPQQPSSMVWKRLSEALPEATENKDRMWLLRFKDLIEKTLTIDPSKRITASEALEHPFFSH